MDFTKAMFFADAPRVMRRGESVGAYLARAVRRSGDGFVKQGNTKMPLPPAGQKIEFGKSSNFLLTWSPQMGEICRADIGLRLDRAPPRVRWQAAVAEVEKPRKEPTQTRSKDDKYVNMLYGVIGAVEAVTRTKDDFQHWLNSPSPPPPPASLIEKKQPPAKKIPPFDLQDIPGAMRKIGAPMGAALMERWFASDLNYAPTPNDERNLINQNGLPFSSDMFDTTTIKMDWVLSFSRAKRGLELLKSQLRTANAKDRIVKILKAYRGRDYIAPWFECKGDIRRYHNEFQFQMAPVEGTLGQKMTQFAAQSLFNDGLPDDLTCALGSFVLYAGISQASFNAKTQSAAVTHINVYVKDNFTFTDDEEGLSQYLGHWNRKHVAIFPSREVARRFNVEWLDHAVVHGYIFDDDAVLYPVKNSDFRKWQKKHNRGGDFIIYSDILTIKLDEPIRVSF